MSSESGGALRQLLALFRIDVDASQLAVADAKINSFVGKLKVTAKVVAEALGAEAIGRFFADQVENAAHLQDLADRLGVASTTIRAFGLAGKAAGLDIEETAHALSYLQRSLGEASLGGAGEGGGQAAQAFEKLGVSAKDAAGKTRPFEDIIGDVADGLAKLPDQNQRAAYAMMIFGREGRTILPILTQGRARIEELVESARNLGNGLGDDYYKRVRNVREEFQKFQFALESLKDRALDVVLPHLLKLGEWLKDKSKDIIAFTEHTNLLQTAMISLATVAGVKLALALGQLASTFGLLKPSVFETIGALLEFALPIVFVTGLYFAFDELFGLMSGSDSVIGRVLTKMYGVQGAKRFVDDLKGSWDDIKGAIGDIEIALKELFPQLKISAQDAVHFLVFTFMALTANGLRFLHTIERMGEELGDLASTIYGTDTKILKNMEGVFGRSITKAMTGIDPDSLTDRGWTGGADWKRDYEKWKAQDDEDEERLADPGGYYERKRGAMRAPTGFSFGPGGVPAPFYAPIPGFVPSRALAPAQVTQTNKFEINIDSDSGKPKDVAKAAREAILESAKKLDNANTLAALKVP